jgi:hypothetical protein
MPRTHVWACRWCAYRTKVFVENTSKERALERALEHHIQVSHTCQYCGAGGLKGQGKSIHEEACLRKQERKLERQKKHEEGLKRAQELKAARQAMLLICLAATAADKDTNPSPINPSPINPSPINPSPIATLAHDVLPCVFKHLLKN